MLHKPGRQWKSEWSQLIAALIRNRNSLFEKLEGKLGFVKHQRDLVLTLLSHKNNTYTKYRICSKQVEGPKDQRIQLLAIQTTTKTSWIWKEGISNSEICNIGKYFI
jgi:hypothetical protein